VEAARPLDPASGELDDRVIRIVLFAASRQEK
jgi:hypothetical protein